MKLDVIDGPEKVRALVIENICPYCEERTTKKLGDGVVGGFGSQTRKKAELVCYHCMNPDCSHTNYYVGKADYEKYGH